MAEDWCCNAEDWRSTRQDWRCDIKVHICSPFGARRRTYCGATNIFQRDIHTHARTCVRTSSQLGVSAPLGQLFTPYLVVELSPSDEIWHVYVTSINDGTQILTFLGIDNNLNFQKSRFFCGNLIILYLRCIVFYFYIDCNCCIPFPNCALMVK